MKPNIHSKIGNIEGTNTAKDIHKSLMEQRNFINNVETYNKYNTAVRMAMSDKYVECTKHKCEVWKKINYLESLLDSKDGRELPYVQYVKLQKDLEYYVQLHNTIRIQLDIWYQAREICMELADEML